ncbi:hypothetical protein D1T48_gp06 [Thermoproteus tenax virus 1]|uniref:Uncharacterized 8.9 kDa protein n=1 Tax=Thermoproteus tenax virus 1 (strain KRA1) TaxID=10480 RepID=YOR6_TTV1K|nr:hypothetical protein D1T48_gp06 [Thermoproteus tenax virus 1]P19281.1 RecName: Full=Uncharacterized 8.9 kDa protein [Thermoproteus tenax virus 1 (STRAIN KRA1)]CAA32975.1 unnamed protein product [Thermoproteus tenax virus 1]
MRHAPSYLSRLFTIVDFYWDFSMIRPICTIWTYSISCTYGIYLLILIYRIFSIFGLDYYHDSLLYSLIFLFYC